MVSNDSALLPGKKQLCDEYASRATLYRHQAISAAKVNEVDDDTDSALLPGRKRKKQLCDHCDKYVSRATLYRHRAISAA